MIEGAIAAATVETAEAIEAAEVAGSACKLSEVGKLPKEVGPKGEAEQLPDEVGSDFDIDKPQEGLTDVEKEKIIKEAGWSSDIVDNIKSMDEYEIYKNAGLQEYEIGGKKCLIRDDIDWSQTDAKGKTNIQRMERGLAPLDKNGEPIQLHHIGQHVDSPLAELTFEEHRCNGNDTILHDKSKETETHGEGNAWDKERQEYWKNRIGNGGAE